MYWYCIEVIFGTNSITSAWDIATRKMDSSYGLFYYDSPNKVEEITPKHNKKSTSILGYIYCWANEEINVMITENLVGNVIFVLFKRAVYYRKPYSNKFFVCNNSRWPDIADWSVSDWRDYLPACMHTT